MTDNELLTLGQVALRLGCGLLPWHLDRLCSRELVPYRRAGRLRLIREPDLGAVLTAARAAGYVRENKELVPA
jgi:hypothetical protein